MRKSGQVCAEERESVRNPKTCTKRGDDRDARERLRDAAGVEMAGLIQQTFQESNFRMCWFNFKTYYCFEVLTEKRISILERQERKRHSRKGMTSLDLRGQ